MEETLEQMKVKVLSDEVFYEGQQYTFKKLTFETHDKNQRVWE